MDFQEYTKAARQTAIYPEQWAGVYPAIGLVDELAEFVEVYSDYPIMPGDYENWRQECIAELGDVLWYYAIFCDDNFLDMEMFFDTMPLYSDSHDVLLTAGKFLGVVKKAMRDGHLPVSAVKVMPYLDNVAGYIAYWCGKLGTTEQEIMEMNIAKLRSRQERGVLQGSGDHR